MNFDGIDTSDLIHQFGVLTKPLLDIRPLLPEFREILHTSIQRNFKVGGRYGTDNPFGGGKRAWIPSKRAVSESGDTLVHTAIGASSISVQITGPQSLAISSNVEYMAIHNFGGKAGRNHATELPARPWAVIQNEDLEDIQDAYLAYASRQLV